MRRPAGWLVTTPPGGVRRHRPSATTSGTCERTNARPRAPLKCIAQPSCHSASKTRVNALMGGPEPKRSPQWSAERRASPARGLRKRICVGCKARRFAPAGLRHWPAKGASQAPERLSALRFPRSCEGRCKARGILPREKDDACLTVARMKRSEMRDRPRGRPRISLRSIRATCSGTRDPRGTSE